MSARKISRMVPAPRGIWLLLALAALIGIGVGLRGLGGLMSGADLMLVRDLAGDRTSTLTVLAHGASVLGRSYVLVPCAVVIAAVAIASGRGVLAVVMIVGVGGAVIIQNVDKAIVGRPRPPVTRLEHVTSTSFPSGHATEASAFFVLLAIAVLASSRSRPLRLLAALAAVAIIFAVALSRVYLGVHYPTDVGAGILLGGAWSVATAVILLRGRTDPEHA